MIARRSLLAGASGLLAAPAIVRAQGANGIALVIGNSKYKWEASLPNVKRDAPDVTKAFQALGLKTELLQDAGKDAMFAAVEKLKAASRGANLAAFYFAGHGASWDKDTYLVPEDADLGNPGTVQTLLSVAALSGATKDAQNRLLVFDNCRNNPADGWRQKAASDTSRVSASERAATALNGPNTMVLFSTAPGRIAVDGPAGENSPFAAMFLRQLAGQSVDLRALPEKLRRDLLIATEGRQVVWDQSTYERPFVLSGGPGRPPSTSHEADRSQIIELPKAFAFAAENGLPLPAGLVAFRPSTDSPNSEKVGSFKFISRIVAGVGKGGTSDVPSILAVISVSETNTAEVVVSTKLAGLDYGVVWRFLTASIVRGRLEFSNLEMADGLATRQHSFSWRDRTSGTYNQQELIFTTRSAPPFFNSPLTRLDG